MNPPIFADVFEPTKRSMSDTNPTQIHVTDEAAGFMPAPGLKIPKGFRRSA